MSILTPLVPPPKSTPSDHLDLPVGGKENSNWTDLYVILIQTGPIVIFLSSDRYTRRHVLRAGTNGRAPYRRERSRCPSQVQGLVCCGSVHLVLCRESFVMPRVAADPSPKVMWVGNLSGYLSSKISWTPIGRVVLRVEVGAIAVSAICERLAAIQVTPKASQNSSKPLPASPQNTFQ